MIVNKQHLKEARILCVCSILGALFFAGLWIAGKWKTKDYVPVQAEIVGLNKQSGTLTQNKHHVTRYVCFVYQYDGQEYTALQRVHIFWGKKEGGTDTVYVNPDDPGVIRDTFNLRLYLISTMFCAMLAILSGSAIAVSR